MLGRDSVQYHPPRNEKGGGGECGATSHLKKITVRGHFARMENRCVTASLEHSLQAVQPRQRGKGIGEKKLEDGEERGRERKREIGSSTKIPQLYIHALLIFALLKDLSATRSAVIPAAPEYRDSIKRGNFLRRTWIGCPENFCRRNVFCTNFDHYYSLLSSRLGSWWYSLWRLIIKIFSNISYNFVKNIYER